MRSLFLPLVASVISFSTAAQGAPMDPVISEFQSENKNTIEDSDGDTPDWLEIYNPADTAVDLAGMALTDDPLVLQKWIFPSVTLASKSCLLVWCSGKNRTNPAAALHTNFDLSKDGEYLALTAADGITKLSEWAPYPAQAEDRSYGSSRPVITQKPVVPGAPCRWRVPTTAIVGWETNGFVDTAWTAGATGIGYDTDTTYLPLIGTGGTVPNGTVSCYVRIPFTLLNPAEVQTMTLRLKYDDGFAAFLNGTRLNPPTAAQTNAPAPVGFNSAATAVNNDSDAVVFESFDITAQKSLLVNGTNILAIQALNQASASSDFLMVPELEVKRVDSAAPPSTGFFASPSPGVNNSGATVIGFVDAPDFSVKRGFHTSPVTVTLSTHTAGAQMRYTTNGTAPTATTGTVYTTPVTISASSVLRAGAFLTGWEPSTVKSHSYLFASQVVNQPVTPAGYPTTWGNAYDFTFGTLTGPLVPADYRMDPTITGNPAYGPLIVPALTTTLPIVSLAGDVTQIFGTAGIYSNGRLTAGVELSASMEFFVPGGTENWQENAGLRMHGGDAPLEHPKKPFRVYFRKDYGTGRLRQPLFPGSPVESFDKLQLRPGGHDGWSVPFGSGAESLARHATYCRDRFLRQTELDMGRLSHRGRYVHLFINGLYWGFYDIHEAQSKEFFSDHLGGEEEDWDVVEHSNTSNPLFDVVDGTGAAMDAALALVRPASNASSQATYDQLQTYINYDEFIDNLIVQMWGAQNDWMGPVFRGVPGVNLTDASRFFNKNWEAGRRSRGGDPSGFFWQVWDAEISMGNSLTSLVATMRVADFNHTLVGTPTSDLPHATGTPGPPGELFYALRKYNPQFRMKVADHLQRHFFNGGAMTVAANQARLQSFRDELDLPIVAESARWGDVNTGDPDVISFNRDVHWRSEMDWFKNTYLPTRNATLLSQFAAIGMWPSTTAPTFSQHGGGVPAGYQLTITDPNPAGGTVYYTLDGTDPMDPPGAAGSTTFFGTALSSTCQYIVPVAGQYTANSWKNLETPADIASWSTGSVALGFDANTTFTPHIVTPVAGMRNVNSTICVRIPFTVTSEQKAALTSLSLKLKYDDGAYIFLNGSAPLYRPNGQATSPLYNHTATAARLDTDAVGWTTFDLTSQIPGLIVGADNILAIQGLNITAADDDFLCSAELVGTSNAVTPPSATALTYTGPLTLPQSGPVKARVEKNGTWSPLTEASFILGVPASAANMVISEFSYNPAPSPDEITAGFISSQLEFIELMNISVQAVELTGCRFDDGISFAFTGSSIVAPGQRILLVSDQTAFLNRHPGATVFGVFQEASNLNNSGERLELLDAAGGHIFDFVYDDNAPWPSSADGGGYSLVLINPLSDPDAADPANWRASVGLRGTPGESDEDTYAEWALRNSVTDGIGSDSNDNGLTNLVEYALGLKSDSPESDGFLSAKLESVDVAGVPGTYLVLRYRHNVAADEARVTPQMSTDMENWTPLTDLVPPAVVTNPDGTEDIAVRSPQPVSTGARVYVRISVSSR